MEKQTQIISDLRKKHRGLYDLLIQLNKTEEKPMNIGFLPEKESNYILSIGSDITQRSFVLVRYDDREEVKPDRNENIKTVEILSYSSVKNPVNNVIDHLRIVISEYSKESHLMIMVRRNNSGDIINEHLRRLYRGEDDIKFFPTAKYSEGGEFVIDKVGRGWKQTKQDEELCLNCMKDALVNQYFVFTSDISEYCFEAVRYKDPKEKESKDRFWFVWGLIAFVRHNRLSIFNEADFDELLFDSNQYSRKVARTLQV